jgi:long-chain acyl-CoA synthetase
MTAVTDVRAEIDAEVAGQTVATRFAEVVAAHGDAVALRGKDDATGEWHELTWAQYADQACRVAAGLRKLGVGQGDRVALMIRNVTEFHVADVAVLLCGATPFSIYNSSAPDQVEYLISHAEAKVAIVENPGFLERVAKVRDELPTLQTIVLISGEPAPASVANGEGSVVRWDELLAEDPVDLAEASKIAQPDDLATLIYTSGTTGPPKGVMITHYNVLWTGVSLLRAFGMSEEELRGMRIVSYLPMAHIAERMTSHYNGIMAAMVVSSCPDTGQIASYLLDVKPHVGFGVPRVWEKIQAGVEAALSADPEKKKSFDDAIAAAIPIVTKRTLEGEDALSDEEKGTLDFLDQVAFAQVRALIGMDEMVRAITGAAPIPLDLVNWYRAIGVPLSEVYGMSENTGPLTWDSVRVKAGSVGRALPGVEVALAPDGEVIARGGNVFTGYLNDPEKTADALDDEGWLHTGDIGEFDDEGYLRIVDRKKELIITAGGKNISPANLEAALKSIPLIGQAAVIGDQRPFMSALLVLDPDAAAAWAKAHGIESSSLATLAEHPDVLAEVDAGVREANAKFSQVEQIKKWKVLGEEWMPDSEELTPTMKLKRRGVNAKYAAEIESLYAR